MVSRIDNPELWLKIRPTISPRIEFNFVLRVSVPAIYETLYVTFFLIAILMYLVISRRKFPLIL